MVYVYKQGVAVGRVGVCSGVGKGGKGKARAYNLCSEIWNVQQAKREVKGVYNSRMVWKQPVRSTRVAGQGRVCRQTVYGT